ncbi:unnamed protein product [Rotaria sordida]|uniref:Uncharacterized protein n=1 Tax=Rotaria sordida TaxID=392033 RepID=A0A814R5S8_9BILA|nr:unnamed protein product [Rotaria sordida]CAF1446864.1 unnamed protein product [Rotaria sordida]CAF3581998.1 unnamed protein product [Rotaria sordida]CAF3883406.1 unnamed protein product [Rotaria sordida]
MAEWLLAVAALYIDWRAARRVRYVYNHALDEIYAEQYGNDYDPSYSYNSQQYSYNPSNSYDHYYHI